MRHSILRDGLIAGVLGATCVAGWFFCVDLFFGQPLATPFALGRGLLGILEITPTNRPLVVAVYTVFHYIAFFGVGVVAAGIIHWAEAVPSVLAGAFLFFVAIEAGFYLMTLILARSPSYGGLSAGQVATGNLIAALAMGTYLWRTHPKLKEGLDYALSGRP
ncbi:MAG: hypothetical protein ABJF01_21345 [bacterium]